MINSFSALQTKLSQMNLKLQKMLHAAHVRSTCMTREVRRAGWERGQRWPQFFPSHASIIDVLKFKCCQRAASPAVH